MAAYSKQDTGYGLVKRILTILGLPVPTSAATTTDPTTVQLWGLLNECGQDIAKMWDWQVCDRVWKFSTVIGQNAYDLPDDFNGLVSSTGWNKSSRIPLVGPLMPPIWEAIDVRTMGSSTMRLYYRVMGDKLVFQNPPVAAIQNIVIEYHSLSWVTSAIDPTEYQDHVEDDGDLVLFDSRLVVEYVRFRWLDTKGFDTTEANRSFLNALEMAKSRDSDAAPLRLDSQTATGVLGYDNIPDTNYGA